MVKQFPNLTAALDEFRMPIPNRDAAWHVSNVVGGFSGFTVRKNVIVAQRSDGNVDIHLGLGSASGFVSEEEATQAAGGRSKRPSQRGDGLWVVDLPVRER